MMKILKSCEIFDFFLIFKFSNFLKLLNFKFFLEKMLTPYWWYIDPPTHEILTPPTHGISTPLPMVFWPPYPWYIDPPTHGILTPYPWYFDPPIHGILTPLPMVYWTPYPCYIDPPIHGILTPLPIEYWLPYTWYFDLPAYLLIRNGGVQNTMGVQFTIQGGFSFQ